MIRHGRHYIQIGQLAVCWRDAWTGRYGIEISYGNRIPWSFIRGFGS